MNKRLNKYIEDHSELENIAPLDLETDDLSEYICKFFRLGSKKTYFKNGNTQCYPDRNRSFVDMYHIIKAKFPNVTMEELAYELTYNLGQVNLESKSKLTSIRCPQVKMVVFREYNVWWDSFTDKNSRAEYGSARTVGIDGLSYNSILSMANKWIKKQNKLINEI